MPLKPEETTLVDDVPDDDAGVFGSGRQSVTGIVESQAADARLVAVESDVAITWNDKK